MNRLSKTLGFLPLSTNAVAGLLCFQIPQRRTSKSKSKSTNRLQLSPLTWKKKLISLLIMIKKGTKSRSKALYNQCWIL